jgi:predicted dehydrogenase
MTSPIKVLVVGYGYWGPNLVRNLFMCPFTQPAGICDRDPQALSRAKQDHSFLPTFSNLEDALETGVDAVMIATPASTHYPIAIQCLKAGKHVLIEKPLTRNAEEARDLIAHSGKTGLVLMVDLTYLYSPAIRWIKHFLAAGQLGQIHFIQCSRLNLGLIQDDINVFWDLAPHDLAILNLLLERGPIRISAHGTAHLSQHVDVGTVTLDYGSDLTANLQVNWLSPVKVRQMVIGGSKRSLVFNDLEPVHKVHVFECAVVPRETVQNPKGFRFEYHRGGSWCPELESAEPLQNLVNHFAECIRTHQTPVSDGWMGCRIVEQLETIDSSLNQEGIPIALENSRQFLVA